MPSDTARGRDGRLTAEEADAPVRVEATDAPRRRRNGHMRLARASAGLHTHPDHGLVERGRRGHGRARLKDEPDAESGQDDPTQPH
jgi:hypothetical protein